MPSSSRRKQSKPQHVSNEHGDSSVSGTQHPTSPHNAGNHSPENLADTISGEQTDRCWGSRGELHNGWEDTNGGQADSSRAHKGEDDITGGEPEVKATPQHSEERMFKCPECSQSFLSKENLIQHQVMIHADDLDLSNSHITQSSSHSLLGKRPLAEIDQSEALCLSGSSPSAADLSTKRLPKPISNNQGDVVTSVLKDDSHSDRLHQSDMELDYSLTSKRLRLDNPMSQLHYQTSAIPPHLEAIYDMQAVAKGVPFPEDRSDRGAIGDSLQIHSCPVCTKQFPKGSDLKRHMMCHTGEKPFRCQYCQKPFRAKSSMHYHLKATHGIEIELSPGLEERYLRMKTRAQMNLLSRGGHLSGLSQLYGSEATNLSRDNHNIIDHFDDTEDDSKSNDSFYHNTSGMGSEGSASVLSKSQGFSKGQTGNEEKLALDLSKSGTEKNSFKDIPMKEGDVLVYGNDLTRAEKLTVKKENVLFSQILGKDLNSGENTSVYKCYLCTQTFSKPTRMQYHLAVHFENPISTYHCCFCSEIFHSKALMQNHLRRKHKLEVAGLKFTSNGTKDFRSSQLNFPGQSTLNDQFPCKFCHKLFDNEISLRKHARLHLWSRNCYCRCCGKVFHQYTSLQLHISRVHAKSKQKSNHGTSWVRSKLNFFCAPRRVKPKNPPAGLSDDIDEPLNLVQGRTNGREAFPHGENYVAGIRQFPPVDNGDISDHGLSQHSSDNNWSESLSDSQTYDVDDVGNEIRSAPKKHLLPSKHDSSPRSSYLSPWKNHQPPVLHHAFGNSIHTKASDASNDEPLNFAKSDASVHDSNNNDSPTNSSPSAAIPHRASSPDINNLTSKLPTTLAAGPEALLPGYGINATSHLLMAKALLAHQTLTHHLNSTSQPMIFPPNHLPPSLAAMTQMMSLPVPNPLLGDTHAGTSKSPSPASHSSSKSAEASPEDRDAGKEGSGSSRMRWDPDKAMWNFNMFSPESNHSDGRKVSSLSRTHSRLGIVQSPINREALCKPTLLSDGRTIYKCPFCSKEFVSYSDINRHMDFHEDIRPYKCQFCDYYARTNSQLKVHMMRHQGIREFCCKLCNYKGVTQSDLNRHMKSQIHMLKSRNACSFCGEGFVTSKNLEKHLDGNCIVKMQKLNGGLDLPIQERVA